MPDPRGIAAFLQRRLDQSGLNEVTAVEAAVWLDDAGVLKDSPTRPGLPLRELLRAGKIMQAEQRPPFPHGRWYIVREGSQSAGRWTRPSTPTLHRDEGLGVTTRPGAGIQRPLPTRADEPGSTSGVSVVQDDPSVKSAFRRAGLLVRGFVGFQRFKGIDLTLVPALPGVYVVLREKESRPVFLDRSPAGWFKGQDPTVPVAELEAAWPDGAHCVYIGKAGSGAPGGRGSVSESESSVSTETADQSGTKAVAEYGNWQTPTNTSSAGCLPLAGIPRYWRLNCSERSWPSTAGDRSAIAPAVD